MSIVFSLGLLIGFMCASMLFGLASLVYAHRRATAYERLITDLSMRLKRVTPLIHSIPEAKLRQVVQELSKAVLERVNDKLPSFLPVSTKAALEDYLGLTVQHDASLLIQSLVSEINTTIAADHLLWQNATLNLVTESCESGVLHPVRLPGTHFRRSAQSPPRIGSQQPTP